MTKKLLNSGIGHHRAATMDERAFIALSCICLITWVYQIAGGQVDVHPSLGASSTISSGSTININSTPRSEGSSSKPSDIVMQTLPPRLATKMELTKYKILVEESIRKSKVKYDGKDASNLKVDELLTASIKHAVLPPPFTTTIQSFDVKLRGYLPIDDKDNKKDNKIAKNKNNAICRVSFEWIAIPGQIQRVVTPPVHFHCSTKDEDELITTPPVGGAAASTVRPTIITKVSGRNSNPSGLLPQSEPRGKDVKITGNPLKEVKKIEIYPTDPNATPKNTSPLPKGEENKEEIIGKLAKAHPKDEAKREEITGKPPIPDPKVETKKEETTTKTQINPKDPNVSPKNTALPKDTANKAEIIKEHPKPNPKDKGNNEKIVASTKSPISNLKTEKKKEEIIIINPLKTNNPKIHPKDPNVSTKKPALPKDTAKKQGITGKLPKPNAKKL